MKKHQIHFLMQHGPEEFYTERLNHAVKSHDGKSKMFSSNFFNRANPTEESQHTLLHHGGEEAANSLISRSPYIHPSAIDKMHKEGWMDGTGAFGYMSIRSGQYPMHLDTLKKIYDTWPADSAMSLDDGFRLGGSKRAEVFKHALKNEELSMEELEKARSRVSKHYGNEDGVLDAINTRIKERSK